MKDDIESYMITYDGKVLEGSVIYFIFPRVHGIARHPTGKQLNRLG